jgi:hypothetical protein
MFSLFYTSNPTPRKCGLSEEVVGEDMEDDARCAKVGKGPVIVPNSAVVCMRR